MPKPAARVACPVLDLRAEGISVVAAHLVHPVAECLVAAVAVALHAVAVVLHVVAAVAHVEVAAAEGAGGNSNHEQKKN